MRPWQIWSAFAACLLLVVAAVGWLSFRALEADDAEVAARVRATTEENSRLALWRMDSTLAPLVAGESALPYYMYEPFYSVERAVGRPLPGKADRAATLPSPLLAELPPHVLLHFQIDERAKFTSPQALADAQRQRAVPKYLSAADVDLAAARLAKIEKLVEPPKLLALLPVGTPAPLAAMALNDLGQNQNGNIASRAPSNDVAELPLQVAQANGPAPGPPVVPQPAPSQPGQSQSGQSQAVPLQTTPSQSAQSQAVPQQTTQSQLSQSANAAFANEPPDLQQQVRGNYEYQARSQILNNPANRLANSAGNNFSPNQSAYFNNGVSAFGPAAGDVRIGAMTPLWLADQLILARRVSVDGHDLIQGCLLDWPAIQRQLLSSIRDLLPDARLSAVASATPDEQAHMLASLPVRLDAQALVELVGQGLSPVRQSLIVTWLLLLLAAVAVALLLQGVMALSERRAAFVSAVTHELRTPLTTFRLYSEMLAEGMVAEESTRQRYLKTLQTEADRLTHLVENVLTYARVERGRPGRRLGPVSVGEIVDRAEERLTQRARQAEMQLLLETDDSIADLQAKGSAEAIGDASAIGDAAAIGEATAIEQILFNLVDNACKYAASATDRALHLSAAREGRRILLSVRDHGPGISAAHQRALFQPFRKSAEEAATSAPGVGLGLALCRRLARDMGGDLTYSAPREGGACFTLELRAV